MDLSQLSAEQEARLGEILQELGLGPDANPSLVVRRTLASLPTLDDLPTRMPSLPDDTPFTMWTPPSDFATECSYSEPDSSLNCSWVLPDDCGDAGYNQQQIEEWLQEATQLNNNPGVFGSSTSESRTPIRWRSTTHRLPSWNSTESLECRRRLRQRMLLSSGQEARLEREYTRDPYCSKKRKLQLGQELNMRPANVATWFRMVRHAVCRSNHS